MLKTIILVFATFCLVQLACSSPPAARNKREDDSSSEEEETQFEKELGDIFSAIIVGTLMTCETFANAKNTHCISFLLPDNEVADRQHHVIAGSLSELWQDLRYMETVQEVYVRTAKNLITYKDSDVVAKWFEAIDKGLTENAEVGQRYKELKSKYETLVVLEPNHLQKEKDKSSDDRADKLKKNLEVKKERVNAVFASRLNNTDDEDTSKDIDRIELKLHTLAKAIVALSKSSDEKFQKLEQIYQESVSAVAAKMVSIDFEVKDAASGLFRELNTKIDADPSLRSEIDEKKKEIMKTLKH